MKKIIDNAKNAGIDSAITPEGLATGKESFGLIFIGQIYNSFANAYNVNEKECYCKMINKLLENDNELKNILPIEPESTEIFKKIKDGIILTKLVNLIYPDTIDERVIIKDDKKSNLNLVINSAISIGCIIETTSDDILNEVKNKVIDLLYQLLKQIVFKKISLQEYPQLLIVKGKEKAKELLTLDHSEDLIKCWFNYILEMNYFPSKLENYKDDLKDSEKYIVLLSILNNDYDKSALKELDLLKRASKVLEKAKKIGAHIYIKNSDIVKGNERLNQFFCAEIFKANNGIKMAKEEAKNILDKLINDDEESVRKERFFRIWINSLKLDGVKIINNLYNLYEDCKNGILLLKIIDKIIPGNVKWEIVEKNTGSSKFKTMMICQEVVDVLKRSGNKINSISGMDIQNGSKNHILAIIWKLIDLYTLKKTGNKSEQNLIIWANSKIPEERKIQNLKEKKLKDGLFWIYLLSAIEPKSINWDFVVVDNPSDKDKEMNAKYVLSVARKLGAIIFVDWKDITEVNEKLLLTLLASLYEIEQKREKEKN